MNVNQETMISIQEAWVAAGGNPLINATKDMLLYSLRLLDEVCDEADLKYDEMRKEIAAKQAKIDALMLEYCPDEMTEEQKKEWKSHQRSIRTSDPVWDQINQKEDISVRGFTTWKECD